MPHRHCERSEAIQSFRKSSKGWMASSQALLALTLVACFVGPVQAQTLPESDNGRYSLLPAPGGVIRLDTRTGVVATCTDKGNGWACTAMPDERVALDAEIGRLLQDNAALKAQLAERPPAITGKIADALPKEDSLKKSEPKIADGERKIEIPLPSDRDMDRVMGFVENAWRRLVDMANRMQRDVSGKI